YGRKVGRYPSRARAGVCLINVRVVSKSCRLRVVSARAPFNFRLDVSRPRRCLLGVIIMLSAENFERSRRYVRIIELRNVKSGGGFNILSRIIRGVIDAFKSRSP